MSDDPWRPMALAMTLARPYRKRIRRPQPMAKRRATIQHLRALALRLGYVPSQYELGQSMGIHFSSAARRFTARPRPVLEDGSRRNCSISIGLHRLYRLAGLVVRAVGERKHEMRPPRESRARAGPKKPRVHVAYDHQVALQIQRLDRMVALERAREDQLPRRLPPLRTPEQAFRLGREG